MGSSRRQLPGLCARSTAEFRVILVRAKLGLHDKFAVGEERVVLTMRMDENASYAYINATGIRRVFIGCFASISAGVLLICIADDKPIKFRNLDSIIGLNELVVLIPEYTWDRITVHGTSDTYVTAFGEL